MARLIEFEGRRIEVPDDASDAEVAQIINASPAPAAQPAPAAAPAPAGTVRDFGVNEGQNRSMAPAPAAPRSTEDLITAPVTQGAIGLREGLARVLGLPVEAINASPKLLNLLPGVEGVGPISDKPFLGTESIEQIIAAPTRAAQAALGRPQVDPAPQNVVERGARRVGQEVGATLVPAGAALTTANRVGVEGARQLPGLARMFVEPAAVAPGKFAAKEATAALAAGGGASIANEVTGKAQAEAEGRPVTAGQNVGDLLGALGGVGAVGVTQAIGSPLLTAARSMMGSPRMADQVVRDVAVDEIARAAGVKPNAAGVVDTAPLAAKVEQGRRVADTVPGFQESLADRTGNPGVAAYEYGRQSGPNSGQFAARRTANTDAVDNAINQVEPQGNPGALRSELEIERDRRLMDAATQRQNAQDALDQGVESLRPALTAEARGADIRAALEDANARVKAAVDKMYEPVNSSTAKVDVKPLADQFKGVSDSMSVAETRRFQPAEAGLPGELADDSAAQPLREVTGIRNALTDQAREAASTGRSNEARIIGQYIDTLDDYVAKAVPEELRGQWDAARAARRDMADRFERPQSGIAQTLDRREGQYTQPDSAVPGKFVQSDQGRIADFEALMREAGSDQRVTGAVRDQILQDVRDRGLLDKPDALQQYLDQYKTVFGKLPELQKELGSAQGLRRQLDTATTAETSILKEIGPQGRSVVAKYLQYSDENADRAVRAVLANKDPSRAADELLTFVNDDPKAVEGARKVFWDIMQKESRSAGETTKTLNGVQPWMPAALKRFVDDPRYDAVAQRLYKDNPDHWQRIKDIADSIQGVDIRNRAKAPNTSGTAQGTNESFLPTTETLASRIFAVERGVVSPAFAAVNVIGIMARKATKNAQVAAVNQAIDRALLDPDWAAQLLKENNPANRAALQRSAKGWMGNEAATLVDLLNDDPDAEIKQKVMEK